MEIKMVQIIDGCNLYEIANSGQIKVIHSPSGNSFQTTASDVLWHSPKVESYQDELLDALKESEKIFPKWHK